jgi:hypothetical protein
MTSSHGDDSPSYCSNCGSALDPGDSYCSDCGDAIGAAEESADESDGEDREAFRRRVNQYLSEGWEIQYDAGDEVALVDRGYGSIGVHILLLIFTGGIGNAIYGWYHYEKTATQIVIGAGDSEEVPGGSGVSSPDAVQHDRSLDPGASETDDDAPLSHYVGAIFLALLGVLVVATSLADLGALLFGIGMLLTSLLLFPPIRSRLRDRHPPTTFGPTQTVEERAVSGTNQLCSVCRDRVEEGVVREYKEEQVAAGIPLYTTEAGENWYCQSCYEDSHRFNTGTAGGEMELETGLD